MRVALVTCVKRPEPDPDEQLLLDACLSVGLDAAYAAWDDAGVNWGDYGLAVVRSSWNYYAHPNDFCGWINKASQATRLLNPPNLMLANIHKSYLLSLERRGVPIVPTRLVPAGSSIPIEDVLADTNWPEFVVKPAISASSYMTESFALSELRTASRLMQEILEERDALVQRFLPRVAKGGEVSLIHIDGELTHGVVKSPRFAGGFEQVSSAIEPTREQAEIAFRALREVSRPWLYARVDLMLADDATWVLSEMELIEPSLFFLQHPPALERMAAAIVRWTETPCCQTGHETRTTETS